MSRSLQMSLPTYRDEPSFTARSYPSRAPLRVSSLMHRRIAREMLGTRCRSAVVVSVVSLCGCEPDRAAAPDRTLAPISVNERLDALAAPIKAKYPGALTRTIRARPGPLTEGQVRGRLGTPATHPEKWKAFQMRAPTAALVFAGHASTALAAQTTVVDTLFGTMQVVVGGTSGEVSVGSRATEYGSVVSNIQAWAFPEIYVGVALPYNPPAVYCNLNNAFFCGAGEQYEIDCEATGGSRIKANSEHYVTYVNGQRGPGYVDRDKACFPSGGGGGGGGGQTSCTTYIIEMSTDGGVTWTEIGRVTIC